MAETTKTPEAKISIKLIVDKVKKRVVYAEADYTFVDILFSFMTLPMGTIVRLLGKLADKKFEALVSLNNLYQSLKDFPERYLSTEECKFLLLSPRSLSYDHCRRLKLKLDDTEPLIYFSCASCHSSRFYRTFLSTSARAKCRSCSKLMTHEYLNTSYVHASDGAVFVSDIATFIVTDDLRVMPYTSGSCIRLLVEHGITDKSCLEDIKLDMGCEQTLYLLKTALSLDSVLSHIVFNGTISIRNSSVFGKNRAFDQTDLIKKEDSSSSKFFLEVSLQKSTGKLLFAESKEDFVDFLFGILSIPLGTVIGELMGRDSSLSCMDNIFKSISNMNVEGYLKSKDIKDMLLEPHIGQQYSSKHQLFSLKGTPLYYNVDQCKDPRIDGGLLKQPGMFMVTDDLIIKPSSSCSTIDTLHEMNVPFDDIEKYEISIGLTEGLRILKASLTSCSTLTDSLEHQLKK